jgi:hypothetical protein
MKMHVGITRCALRFHPTHLLRISGQALLILYLSRSIPAKNLLVLGQPSTGKSTLVSALLQKPPADAGKDEPRTDFAVGYDWADIRDEGEEG